MLDILGLIAGNILNLPGILGLALGMTTRRPLIGCGLGALVGVLSTYVFAGMNMANVAPLEAAIAIVIGALAGGTGSLIRRRGATV